MDTTVLCIGKSKVLLFTAIAGFSFLSNSQEHKLLRSTISSSGAAARLQAGGVSLLVQQSIGQASVIGTSYTDTFILREGFLQPMTGHSDLSPGFETEEIALSVFPNPFSEELVIEFQEELTDPFITVKMYDACGKLSFEGEFESNQKITLYLQSFALTDGVYFLFVFNGKKRKMVKLIHA